MPWERSQVSTALLMKVGHIQRSEIRVKRTD
eukprot:COSAG04_NODE_16196_length_507_cov_0.718137_1_plen_30_part_10